MPARVLLAAVAVLAAAWLAVGWRDARVLEEAREILVQERISPADARKADRRLRQASFLNPDSTPEISLAFLALRTGRPELAERRVREVLRDEPLRSEARNLLMAVRSGGD